MPQKHRREGLLTIDHRNSPGVSQELIQAARAAGKWAPIVGAGQTYESPTVTCCHCGTGVILNPNRTRPRGYCRKCDQYVCDNPLCSAECRPFMKTIDNMQENAFRQEAGYNLLTRS